jgi:dihydrofolate synthase/folylpolyglutamate synthase
LTYQGRNTRIEGLRLALPGRFQHKNLALALAVLEELSALGRMIPEDAIRRAASAVKWPGRMEVFGVGPRVMIDGAHNPHAAVALREALESGFLRRKLTLVLGILGDKDAASIVEHLAPLADRIIFTRSASHRALPPQVLRAAVGDRFDGAKVQPEIRDDLPAAFQTAIEESFDGDLVVITGSLTLVGEARGLLRRLGWMK